MLSVIISPHYYPIHGADYFRRAAALATGCTVKIDISDDTLYDLRQNRPLGTCFFFGTNFAIC
jgi:hypothetical protein